MDYSRSVNLSEGTSIDKIVVHSPVNEGVIKQHLLNKKSIDYFTGGEVLSDLYSLCESYNIDQMSVDVYNKTGESPIVSINIAKWFPEHSKHSNY